MSHARMVRRRLRLARAVHRAIVVEQPLVCGGPPYIVHPTITTACAASLERIATVLGDETHPIDASILGALTVFISDGQSPFFSRDVAAARREVALLQQLVETGLTTSPAKRAPERRSRTALRSLQLSPIAL